MRLFLSKDKSATKALSKTSTKPVSKKKSNEAGSKKRLTEKQNERPHAFLEENPNFKKLDPEIYGKLQSTIHEVVEKTVPEYKEWLNSAFGEKIIADDRSNNGIQSRQGCRLYPENRRNRCYRFQQSHVSRAASLGRT